MQVRSDAVRKGVGEVAFGLMMYRFGEVWNHSVRYRLPEMLSDRVDSCVGYVECCFIL